jgi:hypothetical protein
MKWLTLVGEHRRREQRESDEAAPLTTAEIRAIRDWIAQGAP